MSRSGSPTTPTPDSLTANTLNLATEIRRKPKHHEKDIHHSAPTLVYHDAVAQGAFTNTGSRRLHTRAQRGLLRRLQPSRARSPTTGTRSVSRSTSGQTIGGSSATHRSVISCWIMRRALCSTKMLRYPSVFTLSERRAYVQFASCLPLPRRLPPPLVRSSGYVVSEQANNSGRLRWNIGATAGVHEFPFGTAGGHVHSVCGRPYGRRCRQRYVGHVPHGGGQYAVSRHADMPLARWWIRRPWTTV